MLIPIYLVHLASEAHLLGAGVYLYQKPTHHPPPVENIQGYLSTV